MSNNAIPTGSLIQILHTADVAYNFDNQMHLVLKSIVASTKRVYQESILPHFRIAVDNKTNVRFTLSDKRFGKNIYYIETLCNNEITVGFVNAEDVKVLA